MDTLDIEGWYQIADQEQPVRIDRMIFCVTSDSHDRMEAAEEALLASGDKEAFVDVDIDSLNLNTSPDCGPLEDCQFRVYINSSDHRGHFHLVGHRAIDHGLVYSSAVMVDQIQAG
jgi:hypothetical protein